MKPDQPNNEWHTEFRKKKTQEKMYACMNHTQGTKLNEIYILISWIINNGQKYMYHQRKWDWLTLTRCKIIINLTQSDPSLTNSSLTGRRVLIWSQKVSTFRSLGTVISAWGLMNLGRVCNLPQWCRIIPMDSICKYDTCTDDILEGIRHIKWSHSMFIWYMT